MPSSSLWQRTFLGLLVAVLPPLLLLVGALLLSDSILAAANPDLVALFVVVASVVWAALLAIVYARTLDDDIRSLLTLARRGEATDTTADEARRALAASLDERNRQVGDLARESKAVPIDDEPKRVAMAVASFARSVMRDPTWQLAVLRSHEPELLPAGVYSAEEDGGNPGPVGDLERWASTAAGPIESRRVEGPWGAFAVADVAVDAGVSAILFAPWEGRAEPTRAELDLLSLVGQHAAAALEHSLLYSRVRTQADELHRLAGVQADFLRGVTHDLQTPLTSIAGLAVELRASVDIPSSARNDLDAIAHQAERLRRMVGQLLVASRLEAGAVQPVQEVFAVAPLVERTWEALRAERPFESTVDGPPHLAIGDPDRLEQVLWAVMDNAVKYSPPESPIGVRVAPTNGTLSISVTDRGAGMDVETTDRAFEQFYRSDEARRIAPNGSGIGLYAARGLMRAMGGDVDVMSRIGAGSTVTIRIPAEAIGAEHASRGRTT
jgi:signal transduction histidine kinase